MKLSKRISSTGLCSRRTAEKLICNGIVQVNGIMQKSVLTEVFPEDKVNLSNLALLPGSTFKVPRIWIAHKLPKESLKKTNSPNENTLYQRFQKLPTLHPVNLLDYGAEGICILTDLGDFARFSQNPYANLEKTYRVRVNGVLTDSKLDGLKFGRKIKDVQYKPMFVERDNTKTTGSNVWVNVTTTDSNIRGLKNVFESMFLKVTRQIAVSCGGVRLAGKKHEDKNTEDAVIELASGSILGPIDPLAMQPTYAKSSESMVLPLQKLVLNYLVMQQKTVKNDSIATPLL